MFFIILAKFLIAYIKVLFLKSVKDFFKIKTKCLGEFLNFEIVLIVKICSSNESKSLKIP